MEMTFLLPDEMSQQLRQLPDPDQFVREVIKNALKNRGQQRGMYPAKPTKWATLVQRIHAEPGGLRGYSMQLQHDMQEFRDSFAFTQEVDGEISA